MSSRRSKRIQEISRKTYTPTDIEDRRQLFRLKRLEQDNHQPDPNEELDIPRSNPKYVLRDRKSKLRKTGIAEYFKTRFQKTFDELAEQSYRDIPNGPHYLTASAPKPNRPRRNFCAVCGFFSKYNCIACNEKYCCLECFEIHKDTRCLKWVV